MYNLESKVQKALANNEKHFLVDNNCVVICPWEIKCGAVNISENGFLPQNAEPYFYGFFQKIFTGNETIIATWENSTWLTKVENEYKFQYNFQVGTYYTGAVVVGSADYSTEISAVEGNNDFLSMKNASEVTIRVENWIPTERDMYKLYTIPDLYGGKWFYISSCKPLTDLQTPLNDNGDTTYNDISIPACEITFTSLLDKLQVSGKAVEQYIQYAGIGEPYCIPVVKEHNENAGTENEWIQPKKEVIMLTFEPQSANFLQMELQGINGFGGIEIEGRNLSFENNAWVSSPWKRLLLHETQANQVNDLNRTSLPSRNFYFFPEGSVEFVTSKQLQDDNKTRQDALAMNQSAGKLSMGVEGDWSDLGTGEHKSNSLTANGTHFDYNNKNWLPYSFKGGELQHDTAGNFYCANNISYLTTDTFVDIVNKNSFIYETQPIIPLGFKSSKPYHISSIPIIGKIVTKFWGDKVINPHTTQRKPLNVGYFMDCDVAGMLANIYSSRENNTVYAPLNAVVGDETRASKYLGTTAVNTTICCSLTDRVDDNGTTYDTILFGQRKKADGTWIKQNQQRYYAYENANMKPIKKDSNSVFVIDSITVYGLHKGKIKLTAYNTLDNPIWTTTVQSKASWTNSIRDWATTISTGGWPEQYCEWEISDFPWPERPDKVIEGELALNFATNRTSVGAYIYENGAYQNDWDNSTKVKFRADSRERPSWWDGCYIEKTPITETTTFAYGDLGIPQIIDKTTFKNYVSKITFSINGEIQVKGGQTLKTDSLLDVLINSNDTYTGSVIVGQYGDKMDGSTLPVLARFETESAKKLCANQVNASSSGRRKGTSGGYSTKVTYTVTLGDDGISITLTELDFTNSIGYWLKPIPRSPSQHIGFGDMVFSEGLHQWKLGDITTSKVNVPKCSLIVDTRTVEISGEDTINNYNGVSGATNQYIITYGGQEVLSAVLQLYQAPQGVSILGSKKIQWDTTVPVGTHEFYVYCVHSGKMGYKKITMITAEQPEHPIVKIGISDNIDPYWKTEPDQVIKIRQTVVPSDRPELRICANDVDVTEQFYGLTNIRILSQPAGSSYSIIHPSLDISLRIANGNTPLNGEVVFQVDYQGQQYTFKRLFQLVP